MNRCSCLKISTELVLAVMSFVSALQPVQHDMKVGADDEQLDVLDETSNCAGLATDETPH